MLALTYRPNQFSKVVGQGHVTKTLLNALNEGHLPQSILFSGIHGTGKTTLGRILALALNCENPKNSEPCLECQSCKSILNQSSQDVLELNAADHRGIDAIRTIIDRASYAPLGTAKVFILDEAHRLTVDAQNSLLKILEEPPKNVYFFLATTEKEKLLPTILSRCQIHDLRRVSEENILSNLKSILEKEGKSVKQENLSIIARSSKGSIRDSITILEKVLSTDDSELVEILNSGHVLVTKIFEALAEQSLGSAFLALQEALKTVSVETLNDVIEQELNNLLYAHAGVTDKTDELFSLEFVLEMIDSFTYWKTQLLPLRAFTLETAMARICLKKNVVQTEQSIEIPAKAKKSRPWEQPVESESSF